MVMLTSVLMILIVLMTFVKKLKMKISVICVGFFTSNYTLKQICL